MTGTIGDYLRFVVGNVLIAIAAMSVFGLALAILELLVAIDLGSHTTTELLVGALLTPVLVLAGHGIVILVVVILIVRATTAEVVSSLKRRAFAVAICGAGGLLWILLLISPQIVDRGITAISPQNLVAALPWMAFGLVMRTRRPAAATLEP